METNLLPSRVMGKTASTTNGGMPPTTDHLPEALDGAPRLVLVPAGSTDALRFDHAATLRAGGEAPPAYRYNLAMVTVLQNEAPFLPEWLEYHALYTVGVEHFYLYDDGSSDELRTAIAPHVARGLVTLHSRFDVAMGLDGERRSANMVVAGDSSEAGSEQCEYRRRHGLFHRWTNGTCYINLLFPLQSYMVAHAIDHHGDSATYLGFVDVDVRAQARTEERLSTHC